LFQIVVRSRVETVFASSRYAGLSSGFHPATPRDTTRVGHPHDTLKKRGVCYAPLSGPHLWRSAPAVRHQYGL